MVIEKALESEIEGVEEIRDELEQELPMTIKVTLPEEWDDESFAMYYTTNGKTVAAKMNGEFLDDKTYEVKIFQHGMYAFVNTKQEMGEEPEVEESEPTEDEENAEENIKDSDKENVEDTESEGQMPAVQNIVLQDIENGRLELKVGQEYQLKVEIQPSDAVKPKLYYTTAKKDCITVSQTGLLTGIKQGASIIKVYLEENREIYTQVFVYIK